MVLDDFWRSCTKRSCSMYDRAVEPVEWMVEERSVVERMAEREAHNFLLQHGRPMTNREHRMEDEA
jgi:hypothetical protein